MKQIPLELAERHIAILGATGAGKSYTARGLVERLIAAGRKVAIVDPTGVWYGLRADPNGQPVADTGVMIAGGEHADVDITDDSGRALATAVRELPAPIVIDCSDMYIHARQRLLQDFFEEIYRNGRGALHLVIDECDEVCPQNPMPDTKRLLGAANRIIQRGRAKGFRVMMISQRPAVLHKNALSQASTLVAMRLRAPQDRSAIQDWIRGQADVEQGRAVIDALPRLKVGEGFVWAPDHDVLERVRFGSITTYDSGRAPEHDDEAEPIRLPPAALAEQLREMLAPADDEDDDQGVDHVGESARVKAAEASLANARAERDAYQAERDALAARIRTAELLANKVGTAMRKIRDIVDDIAASMDVSVEPAPTRLETRGSGLSDDEKAARAQALAAARKAEIKADVRRAANGSGPALKSGLLAVLARVHPAKMTWGQVAALGGRKARGGHFNTERKRLRDQGLVLETGEIVQITPKGLAEAGSAIGPAPSSRADWMDLWCSCLPSPAPEMLRMLDDARAPVSAAALAHMMGKQARGGHWNSGMALLRRNHLITEDGSTIALRQESFGEGR